VANEFTATTAVNIVNSEWIQPAFQDYARDWTVSAQFCKPFDLRGKSTLTVAVPSLTSQMGTVSDGGDSVDTEFNATDGTDLSNTAAALTQATITAIEMGIMREITDRALRSTVTGFDLISELANDNARILTTALEDDIVGLFSSLSNTAGSTGVDMTLANLDTAIIGIARRGVRAPDGLVGVLDDEQIDNFQAAVRGENAASEIHPGSNDRFMDIQRDLNNGLTDARMARYKNINLYMCGLCDTANTGADVVGAVFVPWTAANDRMSCFGLAWADMLTFATERNESKRSTEIVTTQDVAPGELLDVAGVQIVTDAPA